MVFPGDFSGIEAEQHGNGFLSQSGQLAFVVVSAVAEHEIGFLSQNLRNLLPGDQNQLLGKEELDVLRGIPLFKF